MSQVVFNKSTEASGLYWLDLSGELPPASTYALGWYTSSTSLPTTLTLTQTWTDPSNGVYLFLASKPASDPQFQTQIALYLAATGRSDIRFLWIANPSDPYPQWRSFVLAARGAQGAYAVSRLASFDFANYSLIVGGGCPITLTDNPPAGQQSGFTFARANGLSASLRFTSGFGAFSYPDQQGQVFLAFSGFGVGTFSFSILLAADATNPDAALAAIDAGLRYFVQEPEYPESDLLRSFRFPVLAQSADVTLYGSLDAVNLFEPTRSYLAFIKDSTTPVTSFDSCWRTALGHLVTLTPAIAQAGAAPFDPGSRLVFAPNPPGTSTLSNPPLYLTFAGSWTLSTTTIENAQTSDVLEPVERVMPGVAGTEYLGIMETGAHQLQFVPGGAAYAPAFVFPDQSIEPSTVADALTSLSGWLTTSWIYIAAPAGKSVYYYAQPDDAEFYHAAAAGSGLISMGRVAAPADGDFTGLALLEVPAALLGSFTSPTQAFPSAPYAGLQAADLAQYRALELQALSPVRRQTITGIPPSAADGRRTQFEFDDTLPVGVTPQGLLGSFSADLMQWNALTLAQTPRRTGAPPQNIVQQLQLANVIGGLKGALQTNQLFLVMSDPTAVLECCSVTFQLTSDALGEIVSSGAAPPAVTDALTQHGVVNTFYASLDAYQTALQAALTPAQYTQYGGLLLFYGAFADLNIADWLFHVSPYHWDWSRENPTIAVFKYANRPLIDLVQDMSAWCWTAGAGGDANAILVQQRLIDIVTNGIAAAGAGQADFAHFSNIAQSAAWNGILFFSVPVSLRELPAQLQGLAAGIDPTRFYVHHLGIEVSPIQDDVTPLALDNSSVFGLIDYESPTDLAYTGVSYDFKVLQLTIRFEDSRIANFASRIEVQLNTLLGSQATLRYAEHGNNIVLNGVYQQQGATGTYVFLEADDNLFDMKSPVLREVDIKQAEFYTLAPADAAADRAQVRTRFVFTGALRFAALPSFDAFSYGNDGELVGGLAFNNLILEMNFSQNDPTTRTFALRADNIGIDPALSVARQQSIVAHFPLTFTAFLQGTESKTPADLGYMSISSPLAQGRMDSPWFGLVFQLELGSLGALAASAGLTTNLIAAWSAAGDDTNVYLGLKMPGSVGAQTQIPIEGILRLNFKKIEIVVIPPPPVPQLPAATRLPTPAQLPAEAERALAIATRPSLPSTVPGGTQYMLKLRGVSLNLLTLTFPPGDIDVYLFGNPETGDASQLGWYAAYSKTE
jgi:hypothetical protein